MTEEICYNEDVEAEGAVTRCKLPVEHRVQGSERGQEFAIEGIVIEKANEEEDRGTRR